MSVSLLICNVVEIVIRELVHLSFSIRDFWWCAITLSMADVTVGFLNDFLSKLGLDQNILILIQSRYYSLISLLFSLVVPSSHLRHSFNQISFI